MYNSRRTEIRLENGRAAPPGAMVFQPPVIDFLEAES